MKIMRAVKKLKFWSRKSKRWTRSLKGIVGEPPPSSFHYHYHYGKVQPSAPPLPSWIDYEEHPETDTAKDFGGSVSDSASSTNAACDILVSDPETNSSHSPVVACDSYQQYMVPNPVYGVPVVPEVQRDRKGRDFGCAINIGAYLIRCFFPCFHIHEVQ